MNRQRLSEQVTHQPELPLFGFPLPALLSEVRREFPSLASLRVGIELHIQPTLATICPDGDIAVIHLHAVLNHPQTPPQVIAFILRHELLHLLICPRTVDGKLTSHPPEFWEAERNFADRRGSWAWLTLVLGSCLRRDTKQECTHVKPNWKRLMNGNRASIAHILQTTQAGGSQADGELDPFF